MWHFSFSAFLAVSLPHFGQNFPLSVVPILLSFNCIPSSFSSVWPHLRREPWFHRDPFHPWTIGKGKTSQFPLLFSGWSSIFSSWLYCGFSVLRSISQKPHGSLFFLLLRQVTLQVFWGLVCLHPLIFWGSWDTLSSSFVINVGHWFFVLPSCSIFMWRFGEIENLCLPHCCLPRILPYQVGALNKLLPHLEQGELL